MEIITHLTLYLSPVALEIFRLFIWLLLLSCLFPPLEKLWAKHPQRLFRQGFFVDLSYYFINSLLPVRLLLWPMAALAWGLHAIIPGELQAMAAGLPLWARLLAAMTAGEIGAYWGHRWMHEIPLLWRFHAVHHSAEQIDWLVNTRAHPLDIMFTRLCGFVPMYALGLVQPSSSHPDSVSLLVVVIGVFWGFFIHANLRWRFGFLEWLIASPAFHHWHHTNDEPALLNKNYAAMFPWLDKLFGTFYLPPTRWPQKYGINDPMPSTLMGQFFQPFVRRKAKRFSLQAGLNAMKPSPRGSD